MARLVDADQLLGRDVRVLLRGRQALVSEQFLDGAEIGPRVQHMGRKRVTQCVRMNFHPLGELGDVAIYDIAHAAGCKPAASSVQENRVCFRLR